MRARIGRRPSAPRGRPAEPASQARSPGILPDALGCARWAPTAERTGEYVHLWGRADLRGPGSSGGERRGLSPAAGAFQGGLLGAWGGGLGGRSLRFRGLLCLSTGSHLDCRFLWTATTAETKNHPALPSFCLSACACGKRHLPNAKGKQNKTIFCSLSPVLG